MTSKEKKIVSIIILIICLLIITFFYLKQRNITYAYLENLQELSTKANTAEKLKISLAESVDIGEIIKKNCISISYKEEIEVKNEELEYITKYRNNPEIYIGTTQIAQEGRTGTQAITIKKIYDEKGKIIKEEQISAVVVKAAKNKIIDIGTKKKESPKISIGNSGSLNFNIALNKPSGFSLEQFEKALTDSKDKYGTFKENAKYFYYAEKQYNINGIFVAAVGIHESAWGTSGIARNKYNLFGYGAYDSNPYNGAYKFENYGESIDLVSRVFVKYYLNPKGSKIYDGGTANGKYYSGNTLSAVNKKYASDKGWANKVYTYMKYLYGKI